MSAAVDADGRSPEPQPWHADGTTRTRRCGRRDALDRRPAGLARDRRGAAAAAGQANRGHDRCPRRSAGRDPRGGDEGRSGAVHRRVSRPRRRRGGASGGAAGLAARQHPPVGWTQMRKVLASDWASDRSALSCGSTRNRQPRPASVRPIAGGRTTAVRWRSRCSTGDRRDGRGRRAQSASAVVAAARLPRGYRRREAVIDRGAREGDRATLRAGMRELGCLPSEPSEWDGDLLYDDMHEVSWWLHAEEPLRARARGRMARHRHDPRGQRPQPHRSAEANDAVSKTSVQVWRRRDLPADARSVDSRSAASHASGPAAHARFEHLLFRGSGWCVGAHMLLSA